MVGYHLPLLSTETMEEIVLFSVLQLLAVVAAAATCRAHGTQGLPEALVAVGLEDKLPLAELAPRARVTMAARAVMAT
jgi:hypothetical protein